MAIEDVKRALREQSLGRAGTYNTKEIETKQVSRPVKFDYIKARKDGLAHDDIEKYVRNAVENLAERGCSTIVLGCTQYPLVADVFERAGSEFGVHIVNPAEFVAREAVKRFGTDGSGSLRFIISQDSEYFRKLVEEFFGNCDVEVL